MILTKSIEAIGHHLHSAGVVIVLGLVIGNCDLFNTVRQCLNYIKGYLI
ncbi:MAG: hypothetical protein ACLVIU_00135 [Paraclostridium sp.]